MWWSYWLFQPSCWLLLSSKCTSFSEEKNLDILSYCNI
jgi:hypothetical protein